MSVSCEDRDRPDHTVGGSRLPGRTLTSRGRARPTTTGADQVDDTAQPPQRYGLPATRPLHDIQDLLERTYRMNTGISGHRPIVIGDVGLSTALCGGLVVGGMACVFDHAIGAQLPDDGGRAFSSGMGSRAGRRALYYRMP